MTKPAYHVLLAYCIALGGGVGLGHAAGAEAASVASDKGEPKRPGRPGGGSGVHAESASALGNKADAGGNLPMGKMKKAASKADASQRVRTVSAGGGAEASAEAGKK